MLPKMLSNRGAGTVAAICRLSTVARSRSSSPFGWVIHCRRPCSIGGGKNCKEKRALTSRQPCAVALKRISIKVTAGVYLKEERVATMVQNSLLFHDGERYRLSSWVVMPNHLHFLATPCAGIELSEIQHSLKSYTAHEANKILGRTGQFWQVEAFDRFIRNHDHYIKTIAYIENNPVKAGLCRAPEEWPFSSAWFSVKKKMTVAVAKREKADLCWERGRPACNERETKRSVVKREQPVS